MPNGYAYLLRSSEDFCQRCGEPLCDHGREREQHGGGRFSYNYICPSGRSYLSPIQGGEE